ncbi:MAG: Vitamin B12-dependent ribonucleotide reductase, partial [Pseudobdellovibrionaceae bacterium]
MKFLKRHFVDSQAKPEKLFRWKFFDCEIKDAKGESVFSMKKVEAPESWSQLAVEIAASKYFRKTGVPGPSGREKSVRQLVSRVVKAIAASGKKQGYFKSQKEFQIFHDELTFILLSQRASFNSPVWFNCGLYQAYGIESDSSHFVWDFKQRKAKLVHGAYQNPQVSACFIQRVEDDLDSIFDLLKNEAKLFKYGSGSGTNFSNLRSKFEVLSGGGTSSGLLSFLEVLDRGAGSIKSGGVTRRAAKMVCLDVDHPEILEFIEWKEKEEKKAQALIRAGYDSDFEGEAYRSVSGQNSNNSVRVSDRFLKAVEKNQDWALMARQKKKV